MDQGLAARSPQGEAPTAHVSGAGGAEPLVGASPPHTRLWTPALLALAGGMDAAPQMGDGPTRAPRSPGSRTSRSPSLARSTVLEMTQPQVGGPRLGSD